MIILKNKHDLTLMRDSGKIAALARAMGGEMAKAGVTTAAINAKIKQVIVSHGAVPSFLGYGGFPGAAAAALCGWLPDRPFGGAGSGSSAGSGRDRKEKPHAPGGGYSF